MVESSELAPYGGQKDIYRGYATNPVPVSKEKKKSIVPPLALPGIGQNLDPVRHHAPYPSFAAPADLEVSPIGGGD